MANKLDIITLLLSRLNNNIDLKDIAEVTIDEVKATELIVGERYQIKTTGTSDFTLVGASSNTDTTENDQGTQFTATGITIGNGVVYLMKQKYGPIPFIGVVFKKNDSGQIYQELDPEIYRGAVKPKFKYIPVKFTDPELNKENLYKVPGDPNPIEAWTGGVGVSLFVDVEDVLLYERIYLKLTEFHEEYMRNIVEPLQMFGDSRSVEFDSATIIDVPGRLLINRIDYKEIGFAVNLNVTNPRILRSSRVRYQYKKADNTWEEVNPLSKNFKVKTTLVDDTNSGIPIQRSEPEIASRGLSLSIVLDDTKELVNDILDYIEIDKDTGDLDIIFDFKQIREWPDGTTREFEFSSYNSSYDEDTNGNYDVLKLTFKEV